MKADIRNRPERTVDGLQYHIHDSSGCIDAVRMGVHLHPVRAVLLAVAVALCGPMAQAQNIEGQIVASQFGEFKVQSQGNGFAFSPASCQVKGGEKNFPAFSPGVPIKVADSNPLYDEVLTPVGVFVNDNNCSVSLDTAYTHTSFYLTSGTGGLQEAINNGQVRGTPNTIILNQEWYSLIGPRSAATVIGSIQGNTTLGIVDVTQTPYVTYSWNGTQYTANGTTGGPPTGAAGGSLSGDYPNPGLAVQALPSGTTATTQPSGDSSNKVATDGFVAAAAAAVTPVGTAGGALSGSYPNPGLNPANVIIPTPSGSQTVTQPSGTYLGVNNLNKVFHVSGFPSTCTTNEGSFTTQLECAWFTVFDIAVANTAIVELDMGYGYYVIDHSLYEPTTNFTGISLVGSGVEGGSVILANATLADAVIYKNETVGGGTWPQLNFRDFSINGEDQAQGCMRLWGVQNPVIKNVGCNSIPNGAPFFYQFGEPNNYGQGWVFGAVIDNVGAANNGTISLPAVANRAVITPTVSGGGIATNGYVVSSGGTGYPQPSAEVVLQPYLLGNQNGTSDQPCTTMPTGLAATVNGSGVITGVTSGTAASGCSGSIYVAILPQTNLTIAGEDIWASDSRIYNSGVYGVGTCFETHSGNTLFFGVHPTNCGTGILAESSAGSTNSVFRDTELDTLVKWGFDIEDSGNGGVIEGTNAFNNFPDSFSPFHIAAGATMQFGPQASLSSSGTTDYHEFLMPYGTYETQGYLPEGSSVCPNDTVGSNLGCILMQPLTVGGPGYTEPLTLWGNLNLSSDSFFSRLAANSFGLGSTSGGSNGTLTLGAIAGNPTTTTQSTSDNSTKIATDAYVQNNLSSYATTSSLSSYAPLASPTLTGTPTVPTAAAQTNTTQAASTANVVASIPANTAAFTNAQTAPAFFPQSKSAGPYVNYFDDYLTTANVSSGSAISGGTGSCAASTAYLDNTSPGNISITGTSSSGTEGWGCVETGGVYQLFDAATSPAWTYETRVQWAALPGTTGAAYQAGFTHTYTASPWTTGIAFSLSSANSNPNHFYCEYGSSPTLTDSTISATASTWTRLTIHNDGTNVHWYVNGVEATACETATSSMPTTAMYMGFTAVPTSATTVTMGIDYLLFQMQVTR